MRNFDYGTQARASRKARRATVEPMWVLPRRGVGGTHETRPRVGDETGRLPRARSTPGTATEALRRVFGQA